MPHMLPKGNDDWPKPFATTRKVNPPSYPLTPAERDATARTNGKSHFVGARALISSRANLDHTISTAITSKSQDPIVLRLENAAVAKKLVRSLQQTIRESERD